MVGVNANWEFSKPTIAENRRTDDTRRPEKAARAPGWIRCRRFGAARLGGAAAEHAGLASSRRSGGALHAIRRGSPANFGAPHPLWRALKRPMPRFLRH